jgi:hypothetical protein
LAFCRCIELIRSASRVVAEEVADVSDERLRSVMAREVAAMVEHAPRCDVRVIAVSQAADRAEVALEIAPVRLGRL